MTNVKGMTVLKSIVYLVMATLAINAVRIATSSMRAQSISVVPAGAVVAPYTATFTERVQARDGRRISAPAQTLALRSDGAAVMQLGNGKTSVRYVRFPSGIFAQVSDALRAKSTTQKQIQDSWIRDPRTNCTHSLVGKIASQGEGNPSLEQVAGYRTARISAGNSTSWFALDHGCALIKRVIDYGDNEASYLDLVTLVPGEPSEALFSVPDDYKEGAPSEFVPPPPPNCDPRCQQSQRTFLERADHSYYKNRAQ
jgi:hypothetical protein